ncbi:hypothetical protein AAKU67_003402 [Oxalobacteraceae bacterium GrIS 2.11]
MEIGDWRKSGVVQQVFVPVLFPNMAIVTFSDALIKRLAANDRRILRDRICSGFCLRLNKRSRTFMVATSSKGKQVRITIGHWPLISVDEARSIAIKILLDCREGKDMSKPIPQKLPSMKEMLPAYANAKPPVSDYLSCNFLN